MIEPFSIFHKVETWKHVGNGMSSKNCRLGKRLCDSFGDESIGEQHKLLDERVGVL